MEIRTREELKTVIREDLFIYLGHNPNMLKCKLLYREDYLIWKYIYYLRKQEFFYAKNKKIRYYIYSILKNRLGSKINMNIRMFCLGRRVRIYHTPLYINGSIGDDCIFFGNNCVGQVKKSNTIYYPTIEKGCIIGFGSIIIGETKIGSNSSIGAGCCVIGDFSQNQLIIGEKAHSYKK